jgi:hypothetical protein
MKLIETENEINKLGDGKKMITTTKTTTRLLCMNKD